MRMLWIGTIFKCEKYKVLGIKDPAQLIKRLCFKCLRPGHRAENCKGSSCRQVGRKHQTFLHREGANQLNNQMKKLFGNSRKANAGEQEKVTSGASSSNAEQTIFDRKITAALSHEETTQDIFLQTAVLVDVQGEIVYLRAILDSESQNNLVTLAAVQRLQLKRKRNNTRVFGLGGNEVSA